MPELPEVEVVRRGLAAHVTDARVLAARSLHPRTTRRQAGGAAEFEARLTGRTLTGTGRRGKFLWLTTDDPDLVLAAHLGMSGQFRVDDPTGAVIEVGSDEPTQPVEAAATGPAAPGDPAVAVPGAHPHARARFDLDRGTLWFLDQRTFGWLLATDLVDGPSGDRVPEVVAGIARDPADPLFDPAVTARRMRTHRVEVKRLLLDQSLISGIGNIYADEALWRAGIHPRRRADRLPQGQVVGLLEHAASVMAEALAEGGTSFDSLYVNVNGRSGYFGRGLQAYGRQGLPCARCGTPILRERFMNRSSHLCPTCQRPPRGSH